MASKIIEHPLRTIELTYNEFKPFHPFEEEMLDRYTTLHNFVKELCEEYNSVQEQYEQHDNNIKTVIQRFKAIKTRMNHLNQSATSAISRMMPDATEIERVISEGKDFKRLLNAFNREVEKLAVESNKMHQIFGPLDNMDERLSEIFKEYKEFRGAFTENTESYSLDYNQYGTDEQGFLGSLNDMAGKQNEFISVCNTVIDRYNFFVEEVEKTFTQWEKCNDMLEMLELMRVRAHDYSKICLN